MNVEHLRSVLGEYPLSRRLAIRVHNDIVLETTVAEMLCKLLEREPSALLTFCGRSDVILRERSDGAPYTQWLEMDMR